MKLLYAPTSPYVRKVVMVAHELGLLDRIELVRSTASPMKVNPDVNAFNPLGKIPTLIVDDELALFDSPVVCEYLASLAPEAGIFPAPGRARWIALRDQALADGVMDAALLCRYELVRPDEKKWSEWTDGQMRKIMLGLDAMEANADGFAERVDIGTLSAACALGFLNFRFESMGWAATHPKLAAWFERFSTRASVVATVPAA